MMVPHRRHFLETLADIGSGYVIAVVLQILVFPLFGIETSYFNMFIIGAIFMSVSMVRGWLWRRFFHLRFYKDEKIDLWSGKERVKEGESEEVNGEMHEEDWEGNKRKWT